MTTIIASAELISVIFMVIILIGMHSKTTEKTASRRLFNVFAIMTTIGLLSDAFSYIIDYGSPRKILLIAVNALSFIVIDICLVLFAYYLIAMIRRKKDIPYRTALVVVVLAVISLIQIIWGIANGKLFSVSDKGLVFGPWRDYMSLLPLACVLVIFCILMMNLKYLGKRHSLALGTFIFFPLIAVIAILISPEFELAYLASALSCEVIFIFIQHEEITEARLQEQIMERISAIDTLTGLKNRRGYDEVIDHSAEHGSTGIFFCDLNELKTMNDKHGHAAGDAYIKRFADILRSVFERKGEICRISGDEFVVLLYDIEEAKLNELKEKLVSVINENNRIASVGSAYGVNRPVMELVGIAEQGMYDDKKCYYRETGRDRRRH